MCPWSPVCSLQPIFAANQTMCAGIQQQMLIIRGIGEHHKGVHDVLELRKWERNKCKVGEVWKEDSWVTCIGWMGFDVIEESASSETANKSAIHDSTAFSESSSVLSSCSTICSSASAKYASTWWASSSIYISKYCIIYVAASPRSTKCWNRCMCGSRLGKSRT